MIPKDVSDAINSARAMAQKGDLSSARELLSRTLEVHPAQPPLANTAGNLAMRAGDLNAAERLFAQAAQLEPGSAEYAINHAIALQRLGRSAEAISALTPIEEAGRKLPKYCNVRAACERERDNLDQARKWYELSLSADRQNARALHGRARVAIESAEPDARTRFDHALAVNPTEPDLWLGKAQALDVEGEVQGARSIAEQLVQQAPGWADGLKFLAQLKLGAGEEDFTEHYRNAVERVPDAPAIWLDWIGLLGGLDHDAQATEVAAEARRKFPSEPLFALLEAIHAGAAGDDDRAEAIFANVSLGDVNRRVHEARHRIRRGEYERAEVLLNNAIESDRSNIAAWALTGIVWRLTGNPRGDWLHLQDNLFRQLPLEADAGVLEAAIPLLHRLHDNSPLPLSQSLRGGTQTRGRLFARTEPELRRLHRAILETLKRYQSELPEKEVEHPLLRHRDEIWRLEGSWSVRLSGGGDYHTSHIHPQGVVSSALYVERSGEEESEPHAGWLEIGRPPPDLRLDLEPLAVLPPKPGHLTLFPSTLYHGTRSFAAGRRMTVAFDVVPED
ncbi:Flp pilus assembly protein TadD, contains TPR repeats [Altererythrobacter xiamenensis]|uniref:Flp pilus assembly protein TadD, contains TPR repeats n=1 Tax=Altererythrobacter xiamenensis TaxID=1316679 RepID=A0A1Y6EHS5_9SPHN|nr:tetratricopeptide repeat protein [Altererythrobacter xiamenensis]SMQ62157.1 Flp pilus assembly protein TadD, contains TPR repeats [Altererythrobacter xiamenensis]